MQSEAIIKAAIQSDPSITTEQRQRIIAALKSPVSTPPRTLTRKQVAEILHLHPGSVKRYDRAGILHPIRITSRTVRYSESEVLELLNKREVQ